MKGVYISLHPDVLEGYILIYFAIDFHLTVFHRKVLRVNDKNGNILFMIIPTLPQDLRLLLVAKLSLLWPDQFKNIDSEFLGIEHLFECLHFSIYNRFSVDVSDLLILFYFILISS